MTQVLFAFVHPDGSPVVNAGFTVQLRRTGFVPEGAGVVVPKTYTFITGVDGTLLVELQPSTTVYTMVMAQGDDDCGGIRYKFYVPDSDEIVKAQDLFLAPPPNSEPWDETAIRMLTEARAAAVQAAATSVAASLDSQNSAAASEASALRAEAIVADASGDADRAERARDSSEAFATDSFNWSSKAAESKVAASASAAAAKRDQVQVAADTATVVAAKDLTVAKSDLAVQSATDAATRAEASAVRAAANDTAAAGSATAAALSETNAETFANDASSSAESAETSKQAALAIEESLRRYLDDLTDVESFRQPGFTDAQTIQAACDSGASLSFGNRVYEFGTNETVLNSLSHAWVCRGTVFKIKDGAIINTNTSRQQHTAVLRVMGLQGFSLTGNWVIEGNRDMQGYPTNTSDFGRGTAILGAAGRRTNGLIEFTPGLDNVTPCRGIFVQNGHIKNAYLNALVLWQCQDVVIHSLRTEYSTMNGITGGGCTNVHIVNPIHYRDGASDAVPADRLPIGFGDRAGVQFREILPNFTAARLGMPSIALVRYAQLNRNINIIGGSAEDCGVESWFLRACFPGRILQCTSTNVGYKRLKGVDTAGNAYFAPAHFWAEFGQYQFDVIGYQTRTTPEDWMAPLLLVCFSFSGSGYTSTANPAAVAGDFTSLVKAKGHCFLNEAGEQQYNFSKGALFTSCTVAEVEIEGCTEDPITIINDPNFNLRPPHDVTLVAKVSHCKADRAVLVARYPAPVGTIAGRANDIKIKLHAHDIKSELTGTDDHALVDVSATMSDYLMDNFEASELVLDGQNASGNFNGVRFRANGASKNVLVSFKQCLNMITALRSQGFRDLKLEGTVDTCLRAWLVDLASSPVDVEEFDISGLRTYGITTEMFNLTGAATRRIKVFRAAGAVLRGRVGARTWAASSTLTLTPDNFAVQLGNYQWQNVTEDYGSSNPTVLIQDMRRKFSTVQKLKEAVPMYIGEFAVVGTDDVYMSCGTRANQWTPLAK